MNRKTTGKRKQLTGNFTRVVSRSQQALLVVCIYDEWGEQTNGTFYEVNDTGQHRYIVQIIIHVCPFWKDKMCSLSMFYLNAGSSPGPTSQKPCRGGWMEVERAVESSWAESRPMRQLRSVGRRRRTRTRTRTRTSTMEMAFKPGTGGLSLVIHHLSLKCVFH